MRIKGFTWPQINLLLFVLIFFSACPPIRDEPYRLSNRILLAYQHEINLDSLRNIIAQDTQLNVQLVGDGILLHSNFSHYLPMDYSLWVNDSLMLVAVNALSYNHSHRIDKKSSQVLFEHKLRQEKTDLVSNIQEGIREARHYYDVSVLPMHEDAQGVTLYPREIFFGFDNETIEPVDSLEVRLPVFGNEDILHFRNGMLDGAFRIFDTKQALLVEGFSKNNLETGDWKYYDRSGFLQWTEQYENGELQAVVYERDAHQRRAEALPTFKQMVFLHRLVFYLLLISILVLAYSYSKFFKYNNSLYKGQKKWSKVFLAIASPAFAVLSVLLCMVFLVCIAAALDYTIGWDLAIGSVGSLMILLLFLLFEFIYYLLTARALEIPFHSALLAMGLLLFAEYFYLFDLGAGII